MTIYTSPEKLKEILAQISAQQTANRTFYNVSVKPYTGSKYPDNTLTVKIG